MKFFPIFPILILISLGQAGAEEKAAAKVEVTLMAIGDPAGGKLRAGSTGCAVVHFLNRTGEKIFLPTAPRQLGLGRVKDWSDASYLSSKQGEGYGWGYRAAHDVPKVKIEFLSKDGKPVHTDATIQLQEIGEIEKGVWGVSPILFSTPAEGGVFTLRFTFDNTIMSQSSGHSITEGGTTKPVTVKEQIELKDIPVIAGDAE